MLARTANLQWGLGHKALKTIYEKAVVPILTYGAPIWVEVILENQEPYEIYKNTKTHKL